MTSSPLLSLVIPSYHGAGLLQEHLPSLIASARRAGSYELIAVLDDNEADDSRRIIESIEPNAKILVNEQNQGFLPTINRGIAETLGEFIALLNNDVSVEPGCFPLLLESFRSADVFGAAPAVFREPGGPQLGFANLLRVRQGKIHVHDHYLVREIQENTEYPTLYVSGGISIVRAKYLRELKGFSPLYSPWYWEDTDLSLRAWRRGWRCLYVPRAAAYHNHSQTIGAMTERRRAIQIDQRRNKILFHWAHLEGINRLTHDLLLILRLGTAWIYGDLDLYKAVRAAFLRRDDLARWHQENRPAFRRSLSEIERILTETLNRPEVQERR